MPGDSGASTPKGEDHPNRSTGHSDSTQRSRRATPEARARYYSPFQPFPDPQEAGPSTRKQSLPLPTDSGEEEMSLSEEEPPTKRRKLESPGDKDKEPSGSSHRP